MTVNIIKQSGFLFKRIEPNKKPPPKPPPKPPLKPPVKYDDYREKLNLSKWKNPHGF